MRTPYLFAIGVSLAASFANAADLSKGIECFEQHQWTDAIGEFLGVLQQDPRNRSAHDYLVLTIQEMQAEKHAENREMRFEILADVSKRLEQNRLDPMPIEAAILKSQQAEKAAKEENWHTQTVMARLEERDGHLAAANDRVLRVLKENPNDVEAHRVLSDLQSAIHTTLTSNTPLSETERATLEGFYAFGQNDYESAAAAWGRARGLISQNVPAEDLARQLSLHHFEPYDRVARAHLQEEREAARVRSLFTEGLAAYEQQDYNKSLDHFRQVALANPDYPQLGFYLVQSEAAVQRQRTRDLSDEKRARATRAFSKGIADFAKGKFTEAKDAFKEVLALDPSHPQAKIYLQQINAQKEAHQTDPAAAQEHYEAGLIAYAGGNQDEAVREWHIALRLDPENQKTVVALHKIQRETELAREVP